LARSTGLTRGRPSMSRDEAITLPTSLQLVLAVSLRKRTLMPRLPQGSCCAALRAGRSRSCRLLTPEVSRKRNSYVFRHLHRLEGVHVDCHRDHLDLGAELVGVSEVEPVGVADRFLRQLHRLHLD